jgi:hypothetical protein
LAFRGFSAKIGERKTGPAGIKIYVLCIIGDGRWGEEEKGRMGEGEKAVRCEA